MTTPSATGSGDGLISASVGFEGANQVADVKLVQTLLNLNPDAIGRLLSVDGKSGSKTIAAIKKYQMARRTTSVPDGRVDPGYDTITRLAQDAVTIPTSPGAAPGAGPGSNAPGGSAGEGSGTNTEFKALVQQFVDFVKTTYGITIRASADIRDADKAQRWHIAHMIKYNSYGTRKPKVNTVIGGRALISFDHLSSPAVAWGGNVDPSFFLRDANGNSVSIQSGAMTSPPDEAKTRARALEVLKTYGTGTAEDRPGDPNSGMVAPGYDGCREPCMCGNKKSKHVRGVAADLSGMTALRAKLVPPTNASVDTLLANYRLHRPIVDKEEWHVELVE